MLALGGQGKCIMRLVVLGRFGFRIRASGERVLALHPHERTRGSRDKIRRAQIPIAREDTVVAKIAIMRFVGDQLFAR